MNILPWLSFNTVRVLIVVNTIEGLRERTEYVPQL